MGSAKKLGMAESRDWASAVGRSERMAMEKGRIMMGEVYA
jgi:hypothetical protein